MVYRWYQQFSEVYTYSRNLGTSLKAYLFIDEFELYAFPQLLINVLFHCRHLFTSTSWFNELGLVVECILEICAMLLLCTQKKQQEKDPSILDGSGVVSLTSAFQCYTHSFSSIYWLCNICNCVETRWWIIELHFFTSSATAIK